MYPQCLQYCFICFFWKLVPFSVNSLPDSSVLFSSHCIFLISVILSENTNWSAYSEWIPCSCCFSLCFILPYPISYVPWCLSSIMLTVRIVICLVIAITTYTVDHHIQTISMLLCSSLLTKLGYILYYPSSASALVQAFIILHFCYKKSFVWLFQI